jgi:hypothetical protein
MIGFLGDEAPVHLTSLYSRLDFTEANQASGSRKSFDQPLNNLAMDFTSIGTRAKGIVNALVHTDVQAGYISLADEVIIILVGIPNSGHDFF